MPVKTDRTQGTWCPWGVQESVAFAAPPAPVSPNPRLIQALTDMGARLTDSNPPWQLLTATGSLAYSSPAELLASESGSMDSLSVDAASANADGETP